jgi:hypothetical protein
MNAVVVHAFGAAPRFATFAEPVARDGEVLATVNAAGLHQIVKSREVTRCRRAHCGSQCLYETAEVNTRCNPT